MASAPESGRTGAGVGSLRFTQATAAFELSWRHAAGTKVLASRLQDDTVPCERDLSVYTCSGDPSLPLLLGRWVKGLARIFQSCSLTEPFHAGLERLLEQGRARRCAIMYSEAVWWRCHRRIITDYLLLNGHAVDHLMGPDHTEHATPTPGAQRTDDGKIVYPSVIDGV